MGQEEESREGDGAGRLVGELHLWWLSGSSEFADSEIVSNGTRLNGNRVDFVAQFVVRERDDDDDG